MTVKPKSNEQIARAATNLGIGVAGLVIVRLIVQGLPMFQEAGWIATGKLTVSAASVIVVDAILLSVLIGFAIQLRAYLFSRFAEIPGLGTMAASLVVLICAGIAYTDFKPLTRAWPSIKDIYKRYLPLEFLRIRCGSAGADHSPALPKQRSHGGGNLASAYSHPFLGRAFKG